MTSTIVFNRLKKPKNNPALLISCYLHIKRKAVVHAPNVLGISNITVLPKPLLRSSRTIASASYIAMKQRAKYTPQKRVRNGGLWQYSAGVKQRYVVMLFINAHQKCTLTSRQTLYLLVTRLSQPKHRTRRRLRHLRSDGVRLNNKRVHEAELVRIVNSGTKLVKQ